MTAVQELEQIEHQFVEQVQFLSGELNLIQQAIIRLQAQIELIELRPQ